MEQKKGSCSNAAAETKRGKRKKEKKNKSSLNPTNLYDIKTKNPVGFRFNHPPILDFNSPFARPSFEQKGF